MTKHTGGTASEAELPRYSAVPPLRVGGPQAQAHHIFDSVLLQNPNLTPPLLLKAQAPCISQQPTKR
jgi:hypothetical protein